MEEVQFINKVWISQKGRKVNKFLCLLCLIYVVLDFLIFIMEGIQMMPLISCIAALILMIWTGKNSKIKGCYIETMCKIEFQWGKIKWQYPSVDFCNGQGIVSVVYYIDETRIKNILVRKEMQSLRMECYPMVECKNRIGKIKTVDYNKNNKVCVLIIYNDNLKKIEELFRQYIKRNIEFVD